MMLPASALDTATRFDRTLRSRALSDPQALPIPIRMLSFCFVVVDTVQWRKKCRTSSTIPTCFLKIFLVVQVTVVVFTWWCYWSGRYKATRSRPEHNRTHSQWTKVLVVELLESWVELIPIRIIVEFSIDWIQIAITYTYPGYAF